MVGDFLFLLIIKIYFIFDKHIIRSMKKLFLYVSFIFSSLLFNAQVTNFLWAKNMGGGNLDEGKSIAIDASGNAYTTGTFVLTSDFDPGVGVFNLTSIGQRDIFISKLDALGNFVWAKCIGQTDVDECQSIDVDGNANVYITGSYTGVVDFDPGAGTYTMASSGINSAFILKLNSSGDFVWAKNIDGPSYEYSYSITIDSNNNIYVTGRFSGICDFDPGPSTYTLGTSNGSNMFVLKLNSSGNFVWAKSMNSISNGLATANCISVDGMGNVYTTGNLQGVVDFDPGVSTYTVNYSAFSGSPFISKINSNGDFVWAKSFEGFSGKGTSLVTDVQGNLFVTGDFNGVVDFDPGPATYTLNAIGGQSTYVVKLNVSGNFVWAMGFLGSNGTTSYAIDVDAGGNIYTAGYFYGTVDFDPTSAVYDLTSAGQCDAFILKLNPSGNMIWAQNFGGTTAEIINDLVLDLSGNIYSTGMFNGMSDFDPTSAISNLTSNGFTDVFVHKMKQPTTGVESNSILNENKIYPNPSNELLKLETTIEHGEIILINSLGENIYEQKIIQGLNYINTEGFKKGIYNYIIFQNNKLMDSGKLLVE